MTLKHTTVYAFDLDAGERQMCAGLARENGVSDRVRVAGFCDPVSLAPLVAPGAALVVDCEGYEDKLLDPQAVPGLRHSTILVELHPTLRTGIVEELRERFAPTHRFDLIRGEHRSAADYPALAGLAAAATFLLLSEGWTVNDGAASSSRRWALLSPRPGGGVDRGDRAGAA